MPMMSHILKYKDSTKTRKPKFCEKKKLVFLQIKKTKVIDDTFRLKYGKKYFTSKCNL